MTRYILTQRQETTRKDQESLSVVKNIDLWEKI